MNSVRCNYFSLRVGGRVTRLSVKGARGDVMLCEQNAAAHPSQGRYTSASGSRLVCGRHGQD